MAQQDQGSSGIKTLDTVFGVIETLREEGPTGVTDIADALGIANSTAHGHLTSLEDHGYVVKTGKQYRLSLRFLHVGSSVRRNMEIDEVAKEPLKSLAEETNEIAWLIVEEDGYAVHLRKAVGRSGIQIHGWIGRRPHMHHLAAGKAILAFLSEERVQEIIDQRGLPPKTEETITDEDELFDHLAEIRERGYAFNDEETYYGLRCVGAPVIAQDEGILGAISVCGPASRFSEERVQDGVIDELLGCTNEIELRISYE